ncbi:aromatic amino acid ammonia-lyase [Streptomyces sp. PTM05]|uniref:Aromatic amino acid ammonia-lyase n=1 Tax=Streptantibioticus parmotrematis TaxID=2873249 RepID=A0ABS7QUW6_9ACTN|nr:aromatic amino acid ammonia-lyase [Streptantibioticus parmotrematis]MBY8887008.1 aromatic amino acid ammonia-lyase [Streptantibioticus parmotrematis]
MSIVLDGSSLTISDVETVACGKADVTISKAAMQAMMRSRDLKEKLVSSGQVIYGVSTGFGDSVTRHIAASKTAELQRNLIRYHVNGTGHDTPPEVVRGTLLIRANCLAKGNSGIRPEVVSRLLWHLTNDALPRIPERGSVGASGDLVPLCYVGSALLGEGEVDHRGKRTSAAELLSRSGLSPIDLEAKEGLALINGTSFSSAFATLAVIKARKLAKLADICSAMTSEAVLGNRGHFTDFIHTAKPHAGQRESAAAIRRLLQGSRLSMTSEQVAELAGGLDGHDYALLPRSIQDRYSIRCAPHVTGVLRDTLDWVSNWLEIEVNSSNDNPLFEPQTGLAHSGGNFYGGHVAQAMDSLKTALANVADLLDRQLAHVVDEKFNNGLTPNLVPAFESDEWRAGLHHGFKGMQIACSAITAEALKQSAPAGIFSRSTEAHNQDKVSMSAIAARDAFYLAQLVEEVVAIHLLALCQALDLRGAERSAPMIHKVHATVRERVPFVGEDRAMENDINSLLILLRGNQLTEIVTECWETEDAV